jgi:hypothetical protein
MIAMRSSHRVHGHSGSARSVAGRTQETPLSIFHASDGFVLREFPTRTVKIKASHIPNTLMGHGGF